MLKSIRLISILLLALMTAQVLIWELPGISAQETGRGQSVRLRMGNGETLDLYDESHALVIGVSKYDGGWRQLPGVERDVAAVSDVLRRQGFSITIVTDPVYEDFERAIRSFIATCGLKERNRLVIYFAGHGHTERLGDDRDQGYIVMRDAPRPDKDPARFFECALSMDQINAYATRIKSKHALFVFDSCFSGSIFRSESDKRRPARIESKSASPVRQFITSGNAGQEVPDDSIFRWYFVRAFDGDGDLDTDGYITGEELGIYLSGRVASDSRDTQTPRYGKIKDARLNIGDVVFALPPKATPKPLEPAPPSPDRCAIAWESIRTTESEQLIESFLAGCKDSPQAFAANLRLNDLRTHRLPEPPASANPAPSAAAASEVMEMVSATVETAPVPHGGHAANDPGIWINPADSSKSTIIGTDKQGGLAVYELSGKQLQYLPDGLMSNVDLRDGFPLGGNKTAIITASNLKDNSVSIYKVNPETRLLEKADARVIKPSITGYSSCMYRSARSGKFYYFSTSNSGDVEQFELFDNGAGKVDARSVRKFKVGSMAGSCVADDDLGHFYVAEVAFGIWKYSAEPDTGTTRIQVDKTSSGNLVADVKGLAIAYYARGKGYLIASSQGNHSYVVYRRDGNNEFVMRFRVATGYGIDGAEETEGIDVTTANLGPAFPKGVFVAQDGFNDKGNQNFKLVPFQMIIKN
jgi:3-phytase